MAILISHFFLSGLIVPVTWKIGTKVLRFISYNIHTLSANLFMQLKWIPKERSNFLLHNDHTRVCALWLWPQPSVLISCSVSLHKGEPKTAFNYNC